MLLSKYHGRHIKDNYQMGIEEDLKTNEQWFEKFLHNCSPTNWQCQYVGGYDRSTGLDGDW